MGLNRIKYLLTQLMGKLLTYDGGRRTEPCQYRHSERGTDSKTIDEVVQRVTQSYHPRHRLDAGDAFPTQPVTHHSRLLDVLEEWVKGPSVLLICHTKEESHVNNDMCGPQR